MQNKKLTHEQAQYQQLANQLETKRPVLKNCLKAFLVGGAICALGQLINIFYYTFFDFTEKTAGDPTVATLIILSVLLTGLGVYDKFGQFAGAGSAVPVTGFANSVAAAAIEHRTEGCVLGVGGNMFKLAGSVIVFGTFSAFVIALIKTIFSSYMGGM